MPNVLFWLLTSGIIVTHPADNIVGLAIPHAAPGAGLEPPTTLQVDPKIGSSVHVYVHS